MNPPMSLRGLLILSSCILVGYLIAIATNWGRCCF